MLQLRGNSAKEVSARLSGELSGPKAPKLHLLPYNRFNLAGENTWWLSPSSENPAYAFGKFFCSNAEGHCEAGHVRCGLHVEKGIEQEAENPSQKMRADWEWHRFVTALTSGTFAKAVEAAAGAVETPLRVHFVATLAGEREELSADTRDGALTGVSTKLSPRVKAFYRMRDCTSFEDLGALLGGDVRKAMSWGWVDAYVSSVFRLVSTGGDDIIRCARMLEQFEPWVHYGKRRVKL